MYWLFLFGTFDLFCYFLQFFCYAVLVTCVFLENFVHFVATLLFLGGSDGLGIVVLDVLYFLVVGVQASNHGSNRLYLLYELLIDLILLVIFLIFLLVVKVVL